MGSAQSLADPDPDHVPSAAAQLWFQKMQASVYRSEPRRRALAAGRSRSARPNPQPTPPAQKSPKPQIQEQPQAPAQHCAAAGALLAAAAHGHARLLKALVGDPEVQRQLGQVRKLQAKIVI